MSNLIIAPFEGLSKGKIERIERFLPNGLPRWFRGYDDGGTGHYDWEGDPKHDFLGTWVDNPDGSIDRYTMVFSGVYNQGKNGYDSSYYYLSLNDYPFHPQGFCQHGETQRSHCDTFRWPKNSISNVPDISWPPAMGRKNHLGKRVPWEHFNTDCQFAFMCDYIDLWKLPVTVSTIITNSALYNGQRRYKMGDND